MHARFVLGPAGAGKTFLCLEEIRQALADEPQGAPLVFLAPKQATFQLERQLLEDPALPGYTRLQILSFERLAQFVLTQLRQPLPPLISEDGRSMVLHALLARRNKELRAFYASAGLAGFARQMSAELRELQRHQLSPAALQDLAGRTGLGRQLGHKLRDFSLLLEDYLAWLRENRLQDAERLPDLAAEALRRADPPLNLIDSLWLDGFAEMSPQELDLLAAVAPHCQRLTLAFCLDPAMGARETSWLSLWSGVARTYARCRERLGTLPEAGWTVEALPRGNQPTRFSANPVLRTLAENWSRSASDAAAGEIPETGSSLRLVQCDKAADEAVMAAREILAFVRNGGRFREAAVLLRRMDGYHDELRRVFTRYEIPFFLDRRESIAHHPLAELTRSALRGAAHEWRHADWFGALKSGLVSPDDGAIDQMENAALEHGWEGKAWFSAFPEDGGKFALAEQLRRAWTPPFARFTQAVAGRPGERLNGADLAEAIRQLWRDLRVEEQLDKWSETAHQPGAATHATVGEQMSAWLDNLALAFAQESFALEDWLPILEAGLAGLTIGVIPPALDQVLIGAIDRSRQPELKLALLLGVNENVFPAHPATGKLLSEGDREELRSHGTALGPDAREFLSREQFYFYIACTRANQRLVVSWARQDGAEEPLNPSWFISRLTNLFPSARIENFVPPELSTAEHPCEWMGPLAAAGEAAEGAPLWEWKPFAPWRARFKSFRAVHAETLSPGVAERLYGPALHTSVSRLEQFAACSFKFFVHSGLRAEERRFFELDVRERGSFQHEALARFHEELRGEKKRWRDITPDDARERMGRIVEEIALQFRAGLMHVTAQARFSARVLAGTLREFAAAMVTWMSQYEFDPVEAELGFGMPEGKLPAWELDLGEGHRLLFRGIIDRIDLHRPAGEPGTLAVVVDYKSGARKLDKVMMAHGLQLQLAAYLTVLRNLPEPERTFGANKLVPGGVFYVNLRGASDSAQSRADVVGKNAVQSVRYQHSGRFDTAILRYLDNRGLAKGGQFNYRLKKNGEPHARSADAMSSAEFQKLLDQVENHLLRMGKEIYAGEIGLNPFQKGTERACEKCEYQGICRFDAWSQPFRHLGMEEAASDTEATD